MMMAAEHYYTYTGRDGDIIPHDVTHVRIDKSVKVIPRHAFYGRRNIEEVVCDVGLEKIEADAFSFCLSLRLVIMPGVKVVSGNVLYACHALAYVECDELELIGWNAFGNSKSLRSINLPSVKIVKGGAFHNCKALTDVKFGNKLERIEACAFKGCRSLRSITLPLKDNMIIRDDIFLGCVNLEHVDLVGGIHDTVAALQLNEWRNDMNEEIDSINQILPHTPAGRGDGDVGEKAIVIRTWIRSVLRKIIHYKAQHHRLLMEAATALELTLPKDIVIE
eukprot:CAMPEP_0113437824 /NCGR_PEP_ID=MMETSP0013_2-20120614/37630_1 /TAXON_ID=2843 ORGANISM="Skeletonema costatum, Strain 1716" /NCGR_SAMPLE_ID=MMETSP0013_2 /ASSEMBLY_ACC=CAM_ASM_000158 /LENGTH=277 /DNA_ID=CAMNT_0000328521 /DNA_START=317 /DNA_END=1147 /DNA_ORIENTATION=- /assembly_acc=CAM_ASM_000158